MLHFVKKWLHTLQVLRPVKLPKSKCNNGEHQPSIMPWVRCGSSHKTLWRCSALVSITLVLGYWRQSFVDRLRKEHSLFRGAGDFVNVVSENGPAISVPESAKCLGEGSKLKLFNDPRWFARHCVSTFDLSLDINLATALEPSVFFAVTHLNLKPTSALFMRRFLLFFFHS